MLIDLDVTIFSRRSYRIYQNIPSGEPQCVQYEIRRTSQTAVVGVRRWPRPIYLIGSHHKFNNSGILRQLKATYCVVEKSFAFPQSDSTSKTPLYTVPPSNFPAAIYHQHKYPPIHNNSSVISYCRIQQEKSGNYCQYSDIFWFQIKGELCILEQKKTNSLSNHKTTINCDGELNLLFETTNCSLACTLTRKLQIVLFMRILYVIGVHGCCKLTAKKKV